MFNITYLWCVKNENIGYYSGMNRIIFTLTSAYINELDGYF